jgi:hypothetical protein
MQASNHLDSSQRRDIYLLLLINLGIPAVILWQLHRGDTNRLVSIWSAWISVLMLNLLFVSAIRNRRHRTGQTLRPKFILFALALAISSGFTTTLAVSLTKEHNNYLQLAQSGIPLRQIEPEQKRLVVELIRRREANSVENNRLAASIKPISPPLYSINSFATKEAMESTSTQLKAAYDLDLDYAKQQEQALQDFRYKMSRTDPSYLQSFDSTWSNEEAAIASDEKTWGASVLNLYAYSIAHSDVISVRNGSHEITDQNVRKNLLQQIDASKALQQTMLSVRQNVGVRQNRLQESLGLNHSN